MELPPARPDRPAAVWREHGTDRAAAWRHPHPRRATLPAVVVSDDLRADAALHMARGGTDLLWRGDHRGARQLLDALKRRLIRPAPGADGPAYLRHRQTTRPASGQRPPRRFMVRLHPLLFPHDRTTVVAT